MQEKLTLAAIVAMDGGRIQKAFDQQLERIVADCDDRANMKKPRKVVLTLTMVPIANDDADFERADFALSVESKIPRKDSATYTAAVTEGGLIYNELSPDAPKQRTIDELRKVVGS